MAFPEKKIEDDDLRAAAEGLCNNLDSKLDAASGAIINSPDLDDLDKEHLLVAVFNCRRHVTTLKNQLLTVFAAEPPAEP